MKHYFEKLYKIKISFFFFSNVCIHRVKTFFKLLNLKGKKLKKTNGRIKLDTNATVFGCFSIAYEYTSAI